jgi:hypothetical protein
LDIVHDGLVTIFVGVLLIVRQASVVKNPPPVIVTGVPAGPEVGLRAMVGPVTTKVVVAKSPVLPVTLTV